ncbi:uncharacterized protein LOC106640870 [Copidosoma floridanum]|uniref:uncharacterized protein LOC106640870 n=1 Tax=Copidosoma floridanum TaxID=29053 RepID=UPI0006C971DF|nr:uncharacterized protein LOC106640870 [Copidosoma floridanum]XP_014210538.1 uncharacterized protein LOC106640870 [Copidosoma floridanum]XP_014210539.1 uncharacterized protein LOC106640870 [Copidosoma floridanum]
MSALLNRDEYKKNPYFDPDDVIYSNYTYFYVAISICSIIAGFLLVLNVVFCYCSQYRGYWRDRHTGNRWINTIWTATPQNNPPLDLSELEGGLRPQYSGTHAVAPYHDEETERGSRQAQQYIELQKRESDF